MADQENPWTTLSSKTVYDNPWVEVTHREVITPAGTEGIYGKIHFKNIAVGVIPVDKDGFTWLVGQYRYTLGQYSWEIPEGGCPEGTPLLASAKRELEEETGLRAQSWEQILHMHLSNSVTDEAGYVFLARQLTQGTAQPEETEELRLRRVPLSEAVAMVLRGEITDALSVAGLLKVQHLLAQK